MLNACNAFVRKYKFRLNFVKIEGEALINV